MYYHIRICSKFVERLIANSYTIDQFTVSIIIIPFHSAVKFKQQNFCMLESNASNICFDIIVNIVN